MRIQIVDNRCEGHGQCEDAAPAVFALDDEGMVRLLHGDVVPDDLQVAARAGARACPVLALTIVEQ